MSEILFSLAQKLVLWLATRVSPDSLRLFAAKTLNTINPDEPMGTALFEAHLRLGTGDAMECGITRRNRATKEIEVYLTRRSNDDPAFPGEWHFPGTFERRKELPFHTARRLCGKELNGRILAGPGIFVQKFYCLPEEIELRGHVNSELWLFPSESGLPQGEDRGWFTLQNLPEPTVRSHRQKLIPAAIAAFKRWEKIGAMGVPGLVLCA